MNTKLTISISILSQLLFAGLKTAALTHQSKIYSITIKEHRQKALCIGKNSFFNTRHLFIRPLYAFEPLFLQNLIFRTFKP